MTTIQRIEAKAKAKGIPLCEVCRRAGVDYSTFWRIKKGRTKPLADTLERLEKACSGT